MGRHVRISSDQRYEGVWANVISITRWRGVSSFQITALRSTLIGCFYSDEMASRRMSVQDWLYYFGFRT